MSRPRTLVKCRQCGCEFKPCKARVRFCSHNCHDVSREVLSAEKLKRLACAGETLPEIARELGVSHTTVFRAIRKYGFESEWRELRYA